MRRTRAPIWPALGLGAALTALAAGVRAAPARPEPPAAKAEAKATEPKVVPFKDLVAALKEQKGKVVVVDFWADG